MPIIQRPDLVSKIRKQYELTGPDAISTISPELVPVVVLEDLSAGDLGGTTKFCMGYAAVSSPTNIGHVQLWNPAGSGIVIVVRAVDAWIQSSGGFYWVFYNAALSGTTGVAINRNTGQTGTPAAEMHQQDSAAPLGAVINYCYFNQGGGPTTLIGFPHKLFEGEGLGVRPVAGAVNANVNFVWEEIPV